MAKYSISKISVVICWLAAFSLPCHAQQIIILGVAQDAGYPHIGCAKQCCLNAWENDSLKNYVVSFALTDTVENKWWLFEATPDITEQLRLFKSITNSKFSFLPDGIFITHAHIGHYTGLMYLGREALNTKAVPVYSLPKLNTFLKDNGPWSQLVALNNIALKPLQADAESMLTKNISVTAFVVPHRDEFSETAGYKIRAGQKQILFIPDIDKWQKWNRNIIEEVKSVDIALLDATFFAEGELQNRSMLEVPHPFVVETMALFEKENASVKNKIHFIHFNHTNPLLWDKEKRNEVEQKGYSISVLKNVY